MPEGLNSVRRWMAAGMTWAAGRLAPKSAQPDTTGLAAPRPEDHVANLRTLSPQYSEAEHKGYVEILTAELTKKSPDAALNIALTGHYGSGKSSVLIKTQEELENKGIRVINLSLPSLGVGDGRIPKDGDARIDTTNLIQKEIVKQLLYRRSPSSTPASRYLRLDTFDTRKAYQRAVFIAVLVTLVALLVRLPGRVRNAIPASAWETANRHAFTHTSAILQWLSLAVVFTASLLAVVWIQRILQQRFRVTELAANAGPAKVTLSQPTSSYFDEYLDEIVYYFQSSETTVVIFEDLDRFKDPYIFETLRELNLLLNTAEQTGRDPIRFVYAIRDSIFEHLDRPLTSADESSNSHVEPVDRPDRSTTEERRLITTNRTKFFDVVVPMVPFISHRTSRDLMLKELESIPPSQRPGNDVVNLVSSYITDMRLIKNICNEFDVFRTRILRAGGLKELTADRLFASIVYKNFFLVDYEDIRNGTSLLDDVYGAYRQWVAQGAAAARQEERTASLGLRRLDATSARSERLGTRLQEVLLGRVEADYTDGQIQVVIAGGETFSWDRLKSANFWRSYLSDTPSLQVTYTASTPYSYPNSQSANLTFEKVQALVGEQFHPGDWMEHDRDEMQSVIHAAALRQQIIAHASLSDAVKATDETFLHNGERQSLADVVSKTFSEQEFVLDLMREGFIDENFTLYVTQFPGDSNAAAMNFVIKCVQTNVMDIDYHFGKSDDEREASIRAALDAESSRILNGNSVYNREIFDYLLVREPSSLAAAIHRLAETADENSDFIDAYLVSGLKAALLAQTLAGQWSGILSYLLGDDPDAVNSDLLSTAISGLNPALTYTISDNQRQTVAQRFHELDVATTSLRDERASAISSVLHQIEVAVPTLSQIAQPLRQQLIDQSAYEINGNNLQTISKSSEDVSLDKISGEEPAAYQHALANIHEYLEVVRANSGFKTIMQPTRFAAVLKDVHEADEDYVEAVAQSAHPNCTVMSYKDIEASLWPALVRADRLELTSTNVAAYIEEYGIDDALSQRLAANEQLVPNEDDAERTQLALTLINAEKLSTDLKLKLLDSLSVPPATVAASNVSTNAHSLIPELVRAGIVADDANAFNVLAASDYETKSELMSASAAFSDYLLSLPLTVNDLHVISWSSTPDSVKQCVLDNLSSLPQAPGPKASAAFLQWAADTGYAVSPERIETLVSNAEVDVAAPAVKLLRTHVSTVDIDLLKRILTELGGVYDQLSDVGLDRPKVPDTDEMRAILERLQVAGVVSKFSEDAKSKTIKVSKHHS